jgi:excisionase family DNA binding protein
MYLPDKQFLTILEIAKFLDLSPNCVRRWVDKGRLSALRSSRTLLVPRLDFERFLKAQGKEARG